MQEGNLTVARVMANAALFEQMLMSGSTAMIFLTLDTGYLLVSNPCLMHAVRAGGPSHGS